LGSVLAFDESLHRLLHHRDELILPSHHCRMFSHSLGRMLPRVLMAWVQGTRGDAKAEEQRIADRSKPSRTAQNSHPRAHVDPVLANANRDARASLTCSTLTSGVLDEGE
jgi:hypothetical protein